MKICTVDDCEYEAQRRGWCFMHYQRWQKHGDPTVGGPRKNDAAKFYREVVLPYDGDECLTWPFNRGTNGYAQLGEKGRTTILSRRLCEDVNGPPPTPKHEAAHSCGRGKRGCVTKRHLSWKTSAQNKADKFLHGTHGRGERNSVAKLSEVDVLFIKASRDMISQRKLAAKFGVGQAAISLIHRGKNWGWLSEDRNVS